MYAMRGKFGSELLLPSTGIFLLFQLIVEYVSLFLAPLCKGSCRTKARLRD